MRPNRDPGLPLSQLATQARCEGVRFSCPGGGGARDLPFDLVVGDLKRRGVGGWDTRIRDVAGFARKPCGCGDLRFVTAPWWR